MSGNPTCRGLIAAVEEHWLLLDLLRFALSGGYVAELQQPLLPADSQAADPAQGTSRSVLT